MMEQEHKKEEVPIQHQPPYISRMQPVTHEAYGGGLYGKDDEEETNNLEKEAKNIEKEPHKPHHPASDTQSADGPDAAKTMTPKHKPPPSSGDRDIDITGQSYIQ